MDDASAGECSNKANAGAGRRRKNKEANMEFCPTCSNLLMVEFDGRLRYYCPTCAYIFNVDRKVTKKMALKAKEVDDVLGGEEAWKNCQWTEACCARCSFPKAIFMQIQIRSADEPSTTFYKCGNMSCGHQWRED